MRGAQVETSSIVILIIIHAAPAYGLRAGRDGPVDFDAVTVIHRRIQPYQFAEDTDLLLIQVDFKAPL
jgi:hypothetical protein